QCRDLFFAIVDHSRIAEDYDRSIVHRMMERGTRQHKSVNERDCDAHIDSLTHIAQHSTGLRTVNDELVINARVTRGNNHRLAIKDKTDVTDEAFIQDLIDNFAIMTAALGQAL